MNKKLILSFLLCLASVANSQVSFCEIKQSDTPIDFAQQTDHQELELQKDQLLGLLAQVDERYGDVAASLKKIEDQIQSTSLSLDKIRKDINDQQAQIEKLDVELAGQIRAAYSLGQHDKLKLMLNQQDPALYSRMMVYYEYLNKSRLEKLKYLQQSVSYLDQLGIDKQRETDSLEKNRIQKKHEQAILVDVRKQRDILIAQLNHDVSPKTDHLSELKDRENKLISLIQTLENEQVDVAEAAENEPDPAIEQDKPVSFPKLYGEFSTLKGKLPLPVRGRLAEMVENPAANINWKGVLINAKEGTDIKAVTKGKVAYAGTLKGYGLLLIIEHDKEFMTLYAFNQSLYKHKGDIVEAGDVIASVGQSGGRSKPGLYFEIRQNGKPVDPLLWCRN